MEIILEQKGTRMAEDGEDWNGLEITILKISFSPIVKQQILISGPISYSIGRENLFTKTNQHCWLVC